MELKATNHNYYCNSGNYYVNGLQNFGRFDCDTWQEFKDAWLLNDGTIDDDYNHCFRFDIKQNEDEEGDPLEGFQLWLFFILQRKGNFVPVCIKEITEDDMPEIEAFLKARYEYLKNQWEEFAL